MIKSDQNNNFMLKTGDILNFLNFWNFPGNGDFARVEPENVRFLGIGLLDFESKTWFENDGFYIDFEKTSVWNYK